MYIQMGMVMVLAVSRDEYKEKDILNRKYLKIQEEENRRYMTTKADKVNHEIGMQNVKKSVEKYHEIMKTKKNDEKSIVIINIKKQCERLLRKKKVFCANGIVIWNKL